MIAEADVASEPRRDRRPPAPVSALATFALGTLIAVCAAWVSRAVWHLGSVEIPWGLALSSLSAAALVVVASALGRGPAFAAVLGWGTGVVLWLVRPGEVVIASDTLGYAFLVLPSLFLLGTAMVLAPGLQEPRR